uniref:Transcriptional regulator n=1 Tax=Vibrio phage P018-4 TaxID=3229728 RepID=A0AB39AK32_9CAUD
MITIDEKDGLSWELVALLEVAAEEAGYSSPESFIIDAAVKEAGKVLARNGDSGGTL